MRTEMARARLRSVSQKPYNRMKFRAGLSQCYPRGVPILMYHHLEPDHPARTPYALSLRQFEDQLDLLQRARFTTIDFQQLSNGISKVGAGSRRSVLITF